MLQKTLSYKKKGCFMLEKLVPPTCQKKNHAVNTVISVPPKPKKFGLLGRSRPKRFSV
jgi:hypothetical protein